MRIFVEPAFGGGNADDIHQLQGPGPPLPAVQRGMRDQVFLDLQADRQHRIERRHRLLENHRDLAAADAPKLFIRHGNEIATAPLDTAAHVSWLADQSHDRAQRDALARPGFADKPDHLARRHVEIDIGGGDRQRRAAYRKSW